MENGQSTQPKDHSSPSPEEVIREVWMPHGSDPDEDAPGVLEAMNALLARHPELASLPPKETIQAYWSGEEWLRMHKKEIKITERFRFDASQGCILDAVWLQEQQGDQTRGTRNV